MTYFRHTAVGTLIDGEQFTFSLHTQKAAGDFIAAHTSFAAAVALLWDGVATPADSIKQLYPVATTVDELVTSELDPLSGHNVHQARSAPALAGTGSGAALPPQTAICVSLRTALPTRAGRGRFFLPAPIVTVSSAGRISATAQGQVLAAVAGMLTAMQGDAFIPVVLHRDDMTSDDITSVDVGDVFDTIRRRRDKLVEARMSTTL